MEFSSSIGSFLAVTIALSIVLHMQTVAAIFCEPGETNITTPSNIDNCRKDLQAECQLQGRVVSKLELNSWPPNNNIKGRICEGCCQVPLPCPPQPPVKWTKCAATDTDKSFRRPGSKKDCHICQDSCESKCDAIGARVGDQICGYLLSSDTVFLGLVCTCCCRARTSFPPPPPPTLPPVPPPSPPPPNICRLEDIYISFLIYGSRGCSFCPTDCEEKCSGIGSSMVVQQCIEGSSSRRCKCCCKNDTPPPPPPPLALPPSAPPPPANSKCKVGDKHAEIRHLNTKDCSPCESDCERRCSAVGTSMTMQICTVETSSVFCECCCK
ncbi:hypothetical protein C5167_012219 [Papaver somniferum]|uniref:4Fe-4S ferredoxin-type domain-containing protein n=1 Tax=Papaver somniferum TaxID=3469 RepID=A0A4Y7J121_PAPSO|nr:uncharacterized protein LOC113360970 [Papaver somniferum]RZC53355.1 hypothetical protein C5167_012219 [Papaver somniferum]